MTGGIKNERVVVATSNHRSEEEDGDTCGKIEAQDDRDTHPQKGDEGCDNGHEKSADHGEDNGDEAREADVKRDFDGELDVDDVDTAQAADPVASIENKSEHDVEENEDVS